VARRKLRSQSEVLERIRALQADVRAAFHRLPSDDPAVIDDVWLGEALGTLLWAVQLAELPAYDHPFSTREVIDAGLEEAQLREREEIELECESARLWHWRARTTGLQKEGTLELPEPYASYDQLIAATAMRGFGQGLLPAPMRGDFRAFDKVYRHLSPEQHAQALSIALERHHALRWASGHGESWHDVTLDT
jgi:hypothetical protein